MNFFICTTKYSGNEAKRDVLGNTRGGDQSNKAERKVNAVHSMQAALWEAPGNAKDCPVKRNWTTVTYAATRRLTPASWPLHKRKCWTEDTVSMGCINRFAACDILESACQPFAFPAFLRGFHVCPCRCSQSRMHRVCDVPHVMQRSLASLEPRIATTERMQERLGRIGFRLTSLNT